MSNAAAARRWVEAIGADHFVHTGDIVADGVRRPQDYQLALAAFDNCAPRMHWLPGNHDIGEDDTTASNTGDAPVTVASLTAWRAAFGADYWRFEIAGWTLIGLNAQLFGGNDTWAEAQSAWLDAQLAETRTKLGVMLHKPLFRDGPGDCDPHRRYLPPAAREKLWRRLKSRDLRFVVCGHTHQWRQQWIEGVEHVWAPSAAYSIPDSLQETIGRKVVGVMVLDLASNGHQFAFVEIDGMHQSELRAHE